MRYVMTLTIDGWKIDRSRTESPGLIVLFKQSKNVMKKLQFLVFAAILIVANSAKAQVAEHQKVIRDYFDGWVTKDWNQVAAQLADGFTFTSPAPDDHLTIDKFKSKCWIQSQYIAKVDLVNVLGNDHEALAIIQLTTTDKKTVRNVEYYVFNKRKIKSIEVFFGGNGGGFPTNAR
jgi:hypothetical protein